MVESQPPQKIGQPAIYDTLSTSWPVLHDSEIPGLETMYIETQELDIQNLEMDIMRLGKGKIKVKSKQWAIMMRAQNIFEDTCVIENPFPTPQLDIITKSDLWRSTARLSNVKGVIQHMDQDMRHIISRLPHTSSISNIMQLHKIHNNLKSRIVHQVKITIRTLCGIESVKSESDINQRMDFLEKKNRYFCKYQLV